MSRNIDHLMRNKMSQDIYNVFKNGIEAAYEKQYDKALNYFEEVIGMAPSYYAAYYNKGLVLRELQRFDEALISFLSAIKYGPQNDKFYCEAGDMLFLKENYEEALKYYNEAISINNRCGHAYLKIAMIFDDIKGQYEEAFTYYDTCTKYDYKNYDAYLRMALILLRMDKKKEAIDHINIALSIKETAAAYLLKGKTTLQLGDSIKAQDYFKKAVDINPEIYPKVKKYSTLTNKSEKDISKDIEEKTQKIKVIENDKIISNPRVDYYKGIDYVIDLAKKNPSTKIKIKLWKEVFSLPSWYILLQGSEKGTVDLRPYWEEIDDKRWFFIFTDVNHAKLSYKNDKNLSDKVNLVSSNPQKMIRAVCEFEESGVFGVIFNQGPHRFKISLENLYYLSKKLMNK